VPFLCSPSVREGAGVHRVGSAATVPQAHGSTGTVRVAGRVANVNACGGPISPAARLRRRPSADLFRLRRARRFGVVAGRTRGGVRPPGPATRHCPGGQRLRQAGPCGRTPPRVRPYGDCEIVYGGERRVMGARRSFQNARRSNAFRVRTQNARRSNAFRVRTQNARRSNAFRVRPLSTQHRDAHRCRRKHRTSRGAASRSPNHLPRRAAAGWDMPSTGGGGVLLSEPLPAGQWRVRGGPTARAQACPTPPRPATTPKRLAPPQAKSNLPKAVK
jgi:hypothetical protein